jgi:prephenate dehydrogenase
MTRTLHLIQPRRAAESEAVVDKIAVIGLGCVGGSIALAAREAWPSVLVIGVDEHEVLEKAMLRHAVDVASHDLTIVGDAGLVVLARDEEQNIEILPELPRYLEGAAIVTDTGGTKASIIEKARELPKHLTFIGGHPVIEPREGGIDAARPDLLAGCPWVLVPPDPPHDEAFDRLWAVVSGLGADPASMSAVDHDRLAAVLAHLPMLAVAAALESIGRSVAADDLRYMDLSVAGLSRLAPASPERWRAIARTNAAPLGAALDDVITTPRTCERTPLGRQLGRGVRQARRRGSPEDGSSGLNPAPASVAPGERRRAGRRT